MAKCQMRGCKKETYDKDEQFCVGCEEIIWEAKCDKQAEYDEQHQHDKEEEEDESDP